MRKSKARTAVLGIAIAVCALLSGCTTGGGGAAANQSGNSLPPATARSAWSAKVFGMVNLGTTGAPGAPITVERISADGKVVASTVTDRSGAFALAGAPDKGRILAYVRGATFSVELGDGATWHWVTLPTTMVSRYMEQHPDVGLADATARVKAYLQIPSTHDIGGGLSDSWRSPFSWSAFVKAAGSTPLDTFIDQQGALVGTGQHRSFRTPHPYPTLFKTLHPDQAAQIGLSARANASASAFLSTLVDNVAADVVAAGVVNVAGWMCDLFGLKIGSGNQTQQELENIISEIASLSVKISTSTLGTSYQASVNTLQPAIARIESASKGYLGDLGGVPPGDSTPPVIDPSAAASVVVGYVADGNQGATLGTDLQLMYNNLLGTDAVPPMISTYAAYVESSQYGVSSPGASYLFMNLRSNATLEMVQGQLDYFGGYVVLALNLAAEYAHLDPNTFSLVAPGSGSPVASNITNAQRALETGMANLATLQQTVPPPTLATDNVLVDTTTGTMWFQVLSGPTAAGDIPSITAGFYDGPWSGFWVTPSRDQVLALRTYALAAAGTGNTVNQGLRNMGFQGVSDDTLLIYCVSPDQTLDYTVVDMSTGKSSNYDGQNKQWNYFLVRACPGPQSPSNLNEDPGTARAASFPLALTNPSAQSVTGAYVAEQLGIDLTSFVTWTTPNGSGFTVSNTPGSQGTATFHTATPGGTATATMCYSLSGTAGQPVTRLNHTISIPVSSFPGARQAPSLKSIEISPYNQTFLEPVKVSCYATGYYSDGTVQNLTSQVSWSVSSASGLATFNTSVPNVLQLVTGEPNEPVTITATLGGVTATAQVSTAFQ